MLPQQRRGGAIRGQPVAQPDRYSEGGDATQSRMVPLDDRASFTQVGLAGQVLHREDGGRRTAIRLADLHDVLLVVSAGPFLDELEQDVAVAPAFEQVVEELDAGPLRIAHRPAQAEPLALLDRDDPDVTVRAGEDRGGRTEAHADAAALLVATFLGIGADILGAREEGGDDLGAGDIEMLSTAHAVAAERCSQPPGRSSESRKELGGEGARLERGGVGAPAIATAAGCEVIGVEIVSLPAGVGARQTEGRDRDRDEVGIQRHEGLRIEPPGAHTGRVLVLDEEVGLGDQGSNPFASLGRVEVQGVRALPFVEKEEAAALLGVGLVPREGAPTPREVAQPGLLDLDHVGTVVSEEPGTKGRRYAVAELHDAKAREDTGLRGPVLRGRHLGHSPCRSATIRATASSSAGSSGIVRVSASARPSYKSRRTAASPS